MAKHELMGGKLHLYKRDDSRFWWCATFLNGKNRRSSTKEEGLAQAKDFAEDWYLTLKDKSRRGELKGGKTFKHAADRFMEEYEVVTQGQRNPRYVEGHRKRLRLHLLPFFGSKAVQEITPGLVQDYRYHRIKTNGLSKADPDSVESEKAIKPPARSTLHQEIVCLRQVLKFANRNGWLPYLPNLSPAYRSSSKITHRAWFSPAEYKSLYEASRERAKNPKKERWRTASENLHDFILFMVNTGLRPDEALRLEYRDVEIVTENAERILHIEVRGKRGVGYCKSTPGAVLPFQRLKKRNNGEATDKLFPTLQRELFNALLNELDLKTDRDGQQRTFYSLRHSYICIRLMEGADIYQVAKNCRTSVEMIEKYYASHIKNTLDAAAINVRKAKPSRQTALPAAEARNRRGKPLNDLGGKGGHA